MVPTYAATIQTKSSATNYADSAWLHAQYKPVASSSSQTVIEAPSIPFIPALVRAVGHCEALFIQQLHYWGSQGMGKIQDGQRWVYNSYEDWSQQLVCSVSNVQKIVRKLEDMGVLSTKIDTKPHTKNHVKWYSINYQVLKDLGLTVAAQERKKEKQKPRYNYSLTACNDNASATVEQAPASEENKKEMESTGGVVKSNTHTIYQDYSFINKTRPTLIAATASQMFQIWREIVHAAHQGKRTIKLTARRIQRLWQRFQREFNGSLEKWRAYCESIASNEFLMGRGARKWKATLDWALNPEKIKRVLTGFYQRWKPKEHEAKKETAVILETPTQQIHASTEPPVWRKACDIIRREIGEASYSSWITGLRLSEWGGAEVVVSAPTQFHRDWVENNYHKTIMRALRESGLRFKDVYFDVRSPRS